MSKVHERDSAAKGLYILKQKEQKLYMPGGRTPVKFTPSEYRVQAVHTWPGTWAWS